MRYLLLVLIILIYGISGYSQSATRSYGTMVVEITKQKRPKKIIVKVQRPYTFPGTDSSWIQSLEKSLEGSMPYKNGARAGKYTVSVRYLIEKDGSLSDAHCILDPGFGMCRQVIAELRRKHPGRWGPGSKVGKYHTSATTDSTRKE